MDAQLWLIWRDPATRLRYKVGVLSSNKVGYSFEYINPELEGAIQKGFDYFPGFNDLEKKYESEFLFPNIKNRLPNHQRPDYLDLMNQFDLSAHASDWEILTKTKGRLATDDYEFVEPFNPAKIEFDVAGTGHREDFDTFKNEIKINDKVYLELEANNKYDQDAIKVLLKKPEKTYHLGYVPRYYSPNLANAIRENLNYSAMIKKINFSNGKHDDDITMVVKIIF